MSRCGHESLPPTQHCAERKDVQFRRLTPTREAARVAVGCSTELHSKTTLSLAVVQQVCMEADLTSGVLQVPGYFQVRVVFQYVTFVMACEIVRVRSH